ncbi:helix-turn-helix domain-containing protein [Bacillus benzoevorans]|uniref:Sugar diacid utilization regulator n=1 Tax=Bacillus benzoevorans TaxID=1456 RepID=A0A7X0HR93_9BACI|nr:helix-turn-helix domain-containing protein [Bacillus benzoevorans]MBB6444287.1 sugar diacid utilization regulator [Bacillus benzoevorans]
MEDTLTRRQLQSLIHISNLLNTSFDINTIFELMLSETISVVDAAEGGSLWLYDKNKDILIAQSAQGVFYPKIFQQIRLKPGESMTGMTFQAGKSVFFPSEKEIKDALATLSSKNGSLLTQSIPENFSFSSVISSPIVLNGQSIGVFTLDSFQQSLNFKAEDMNLLEAICHQAAVALERSNLYKEKEDTVQKLSNSIEVHRNLAYLVLQGEGLHSILQNIHQWIGQNTFLFDDLGELVAASYLAEPSSALLKLVRKKAGLFVKSNKNNLEVTEMRIEGTHYHLVCFPLGSRPNFLGLLLILSAKKMNGMDIAALEHACTVLSLELFKEQAVFDTQQRLNGEFVKKLYSGHIDEALIQKAKSLNFDPSLNYVAMIIEFQPTSNPMLSRDGFMRKMIQLIHQSLTDSLTQNMTVEHQNQIVVLLSNPNQSESAWLISHIKGKVKLIQQEIQQRNWNVKAAFGIGRMKQGLLNVQYSLQEAEKCLKYIQRFRCENRIISYSDLGIQRFILQHSEEEVHEFIHEVLGPLIEYDESRNGELLKTLYIYLEKNKNTKRTAETLHVHINTLNYRLKRIEEILSLDLTAGTQLLNLHLAVSLCGHTEQLSAIEKS